MGGIEPPAEPAFNRRTRTVELTSTGLLLCIVIGITLIQSVSNWLIGYSCYSHWFEYQAWRPSQMAQGSGATRRFFKLDAVQTYTCITEPIALYAV